MTREETKQIMAVLQAGYPRFYKDISKLEATAVINLWATMFSQEPAKVVIEAVKALMCTLKYPPTIADVKEKIQELTQPEQLTEMEAWNMVKKAMNTNNYAESFNLLPLVIQRVVGSANQLKEWAFTEGSMSVISSNFMRSYKVMAAREREYAKLPESSKQLMKQLTSQVDKMLE